jgi:aminomethyltransferase
MSKVTPLHPLHVELGAKLVDFAGWQMPLHYGSQLEEHARVRSDAGMFDVSHMRVADIEGPDARQLLRYALSNDVGKLPGHGRALYSCLLAENGGILDDLIVYFLRDDCYRLVLNAATGEKDIAWLQALSRSRHADVAVNTHESLCIVAVQGPSARERLWSALPGSREVSANLEAFEASWHGSAMIARTGYTGEDGFEIILPAEDAVDLWRALHAEGVQPCGLGARDTLRLEAGMHLYGQDMDETVTPYECGLGWTVDTKTDRDFCGKPALAGREQRFQMLGLVLADQGVLRSHQTVDCDGATGVLTSGGYAPTLRRSIALARLPLAARIGDTVHVTVRNQSLRALIVKPRFVRHGKALV